MTDLTPLLQTLVGGGLALLGGFLAPMWMDRVRRRREARHLALAFSGEIMALQRMVEIRHYIQDLEQCIERMRETRQPVYFSVMIHREYGLVYREHVSRIGLLKPPLPERLTMFYTHMQSILEDMEDITNWAKMQQLGKAPLLRRYQELLGLLHSTKVLGNQILEHISQAYH
jgi:hypothetical protein